MSVNMSVKKAANGVISTFLALFRVNGIQEVNGSIPSVSTKNR